MPSYRQRKSTRKYSIRKLQQIHGLTHPADNPKPDEEEARLKPDWRNTANGATETANRTRIAKRCVAAELRTTPT